MKTILIVLTVLLSYSTQAQVTPPKKASKIVQVLDSNAFTTTYKLYETQNMWTFIKLNTRNGLMWIVQYSTEDSSRFEVYLNLLPLIEKDKEVNGRFILHPTQNMWNFILLDQVDGKMWQVQWSGERENIGIWPIE